MCHNSVQHQDRSAFLFNIKQNIFVDPSRTAKSFENARDNIGLKKLANIVVSRAGLLGSDRVRA